MTAAWIIVVLIAIFVITRLFRSNKMFLALLISSFLGLVVGMISGEMVAKTKKSETTSIFTITTSKDEAPCIQFLALVEPLMSNDQSGTVGYEVACDNLLDRCSESYLMRGRDQPFIVDDS